MVKYGKIIELTVIGRFFIAMFDCQQNIVLKKYWELIIEQLQTPQHQAKFIPKKGIFTLGIDPQIVPG